MAIKHNINVRESVRTHAQMLPKAKIRPYFCACTCVMAGAGGRRKRRGGYDCEFVDPPPEAFQTVCPICLQILRQPCLISCPCNQKLCRECVQQISKDNKPCPLCNKSNFTFMPDHGFERSLKELDVWCSYKKQGCEWRGKLREFELHLNENSSPENQLNGCQFVEVECTYKCGEWFQRHHITNHEAKECKKRPYSCDYCRDYQSTFEDVTGIHYPRCSKYPVACPNECQVYKFKREELTNHLQDQCPLTLVDCPFHCAGCQIQLLRKDMPDHVRETATHLILLASVTQSLAKKNQELQQTTLELGQTSAELRQTIAELQQREQQYQDKQKATTETIQNLKEEIHELKLNSGFPIDSFKQTDGSIYSPAFYTHPHGYRMCVHVAPNGFGFGKGTHVSIYTCLMRGPFDDHLKWPFRGLISIQIVNQAGDHDHTKETICYNDETPDKYANRMTDQERAKGWGITTFLAHDALHYNAEKKTQYLKDNYLVVSVIPVKVNMYSVP